MLKWFYKCRKKFGPWIKPRNVILGFGNPNREVWMIELDFSMWFLSQSFLLTISYLIKKYLLRV